MRPTLGMLVDGVEDDIRVAACYRLTDDGVELAMRNRLCPHFMKYLFRIDGDTVTFTMEAFADFVVGEDRPVVGRLPSDEK